MTTARSYRWLFWLVAGLGLAADQASKYALFLGYYPTGGDIVLIPGAFKLQVPDYRLPHPRPYPEDANAVLQFLRGTDWRPHVNTGALFGIGQGNNYVFTAISLAAAGFIVVWSGRESASRDRFLSVALGLILAGTMGNFYDRLVFDGVRDFFHWDLWYNWPDFNVADVCLVFGASMLLLEAFFPKTSDTPAPAPLRDSAPAS